MGLFDAFSGSGGGNPLSSAITSGANFGANLLQTDQNRKAANKQMDFQERMSSTAHQREVADLRAAGLNPILSAKYGGSSTPSGAGFSATNVMSNVVNDASTVNSASNANRLLPVQIGNTQADTKLKDTNAGLAAANITVAENQAALLDQQKAESTARTIGLNADNIGKGVDAEYIKAHPWLRNLGTTLDAVGLKAALGSWGAKRSPGTVINKSYPKYPTSETPIIQGD